MSSILKALKKAEEARADQSIASLPEKQYYADSASPKTNQLIVIVCIAIIAVAGGYFLYVRTIMKTRATTDVARPQMEQSGTSHNIDKFDRNTGIAIAQNNGVDLIRQGRYAEAEMTLKKALEAYPDNAEIYNNLGLALRKQNRLKEAAAQYSIALKLKPDYPEALNNLGVIKGLEGNRKMAEKLFRKALLINKEYADAYLNLGLLLEDTSDISGAKDCLAKYLKLSPDPVFKRQIEKHLSVMER